MYYLAERLSRKQLGQLVRLLTGHDYLRGGVWQANGELMRQRLEKDSTCRRCEEEKESAGHLVARCPALAYERWTIFGVFFLQDIGGEGPELVMEMLKKSKAMDWESEGLNADRH